MKKLLYGILSSVVLFACSVDNEELSPNQQNLTYELAQDKSAAGLYKGVFTTVDSEFRAKVAIEIKASNETKYGHTATFEMQNGETYTAVSNQPISHGEAIEDLVFTSDDISFTFSVDENGKNVVVENVTFQGVESSLLAKKSTTKNPIVNFTGTYNCVECGPTTDMTFNVMVSGDGTGPQTYDTQMNFNNNTYFGTGIQNGCATDPINADLTICNAESGDGLGDLTGFTVGSNGYTVEWIGQMIYNTVSPDCSEIVGLWYFRRGTSEQKSGTFKTDEAFVCLDRLRYEDFEDATVSYTTTTPEFTDGTTDYFIRTNGSDIGGGVAFSDISGTSYFAAQDIDGEVASPIQSVVFENIDVSLYSAIYFDAIFAEDDDGTSEDWDDSDYVRVEYSFDGGTTWTPILAFANDGSEFNTAPQEDTDFDGVGDGEFLTSAFQPFRGSFENNATNNPTNSTNVSIRIQMSLNSGDEDIAFDNVIIRGY
ncbi:hypothetical protein MG296_14275 [Flavobacteriaceae bacterium TK19130]|nr:hypothetical protein [Thermobacterium salinum]